MTDMQRKRRGRPKGSEIDDSEALQHIADLLVEGRARNVAGAVRVLAGHRPSLIRRLQRKFCRERGTLLAAAHARAESLALEEGQRQNQLLRATQPHRWSQEHDSAVQLLDALALERQDRLKKSFARD
ncbi:hypothetical protein [Pelagibius sp.]|uniref:hypothetical protein n=1 Tax=Pelagibius sp. TaxID=1931238 RepID=UPI0026041D73|nr:hypothetical protein [Pelagibius sp.]